MSDTHGPSGEPADPSSEQPADQPSDQPFEQPSDQTGVGSVGDEAAKLFGALSDLARDSTASGADAAGPLSALGGLGGLGGVGGLGATLSGLVDHAAATASEISAHLATGAAECTYCPVCRAVHVVRQTSPEVKTHLAGAASSFLQAMAAMLATLPPSASERQQDPGVERIDLDDTDDLDDPADPGAPDDTEDDDV